MAVIKYLECDICGKKIVGMHKKIKGFYSFGTLNEHVCWECWEELRKIVNQKKKEKRYVT